MSATIKQALISGFSLFLCGSALAQPASFGGHAPRADTTGIVDKTETTPLNDAVLLMAPEQLSLLFPRRVRLVKLTLRDDTSEWIDISFRYNPRPETQYTWELPALADATYYKADWAILGVNDQLIRGSFSFAFGPDAQRPSVTRAAEELLLQQRYGDPDVRYVAPPRTQIILPQDSPNYDPPFTINLDSPDPD